MDIQEKLKFVLDVARDQLIGRSYSFGRDLDGKSLEWYVIDVLPLIHSEFPGSYYVPVELAWRGNTSKIRKSLVHGRRNMGMILHGMLVNLKYLDCIRKGIRTDYLLGKFRDNFRGDNKGLLFVSGSDEIQNLGAKQRIRFMPVTEPELTWHQVSARAIGRLQELITGVGFSCSPQHEDFVHYEY